MANKTKIYVVGHEGGTSNDSGAFEWRIKKSTSDTLFADWDNKKSAGAIVYRGVVDVPTKMVDDFLLSKDETEITTFIEEYLTINNWEDSFK